MQSGSLSVNDPKVQEAELHYGDQPTGPGASAENPGGVFPHAAPEPAEPAHQNRTEQAMAGGVQGGTQAPAIPQPSGGVPGTGNPDDTANDPRIVFSNPMMFSEQMIKIDHVLTEVINAIQDEAGSGISDVGRALQDKFKGWRQEVTDMRKGKPLPAAKGQTTVERDGDGGLYTD